MEKREIPRIESLPYFLVCFRGRKYKVDNISEIGLGFVTNNIGTMEVGDEIVVTIKMNSSEYLMNTTIAHVTPIHLYKPLKFFSVGLRFLGSKDDKVRVISAVNKFRQKQELKK